MRGSNCYEREISKLRSMLTDMSACLEENGVDIIERDATKARLDALLSALAKYRKVRMESDGIWNPRVGSAWAEVLAITCPKQEAPCPTPTG